MVVLVFIALSAVGARLASRIKSDMGRRWQESIQGTLRNPGPPTGWIYRLRTSRTYSVAHDRWRLSLAPALWVILLLYFGVTLASHVAFNIIDVAGYICREKGSATGLAKGEKRVVTFNTASICTATGIQLDKRGRYLIVLKSREPQWYDGNIRTSRLASTASKRGLGGGRYSW